MTGSSTLLMGAVAYSPKVVTIWDGFRAFFNRHGLPFDYILYTNYERMTDDLLDGRLDVAWNSPLAWVRAERIARARGVRVRALVIPDTHLDMRSVIIVRPDDGISRLEDLRGKVVAVGAIDSPQATILPLDHLRARGLTPGLDFEVQRHDVLGGLHGDHVGGERDAVKALAAGTADAACLNAKNHAAFIGDGTLVPMATVVLAVTEPYDHCNMTAGPAAPPALADRLSSLMLSMDYEDPEVRPLLDLEGLREWRAGRTEGYQLLQRAVDGAGFYDPSGAITMPEYVF